MRIRREHPLARLFAELVWRHFFGDMQLHAPDVANYVSELLTDFAHIDNLYRIRNARGQPLEDVGEMLVESNPRLEARSFAREREVRKHIGDYTLFMAGIFPESVTLARRHRQMRLDAFVDYIQAGKESYALVGSFDQFEYRDEASVFRRMAENFELCVFGLNLVKQDLERLERQYYLRLRTAAEMESRA
jgi:hypothetical protein